MVYGSFSLAPFAPKNEIGTFIEFGVARTRLEEQVIDEPLAIMAISNWLYEEGRFSLLDCLRRELGKHAPRKNGFQAYLAFYIHKVFEKASRLNDVFSFRGDFARRQGSDLPWQSEEFELVTVSSPVGTGEQQTSVVAPLRGPSSNVGFLAKTDDEVLNWASENQNRYAFCFPTETAGPDIFFYLRNKSTGELLLVAMQAKFYQDVDSATLVDGVRTVTPSLFWKGKGGKVRTT